MISILIPCYNVAKTLEETLQSVVQCKLQTWEAILVNDGSTDTTPNIIDKWVQKDSRFKSIHQKNRGLGNARNQGLKSATYSYVLPLDADNLLLPGFVEKAIDFLELDQNIAAVYGEAILFGDQSGIWSPGKLEVFRMLKYNYIDACSVIRKDCLLKIGGYEEALPHQGHEDWDVWLGFIENGYSIEFLKIPAFKYRVTENSMINEFNPKMMSANIDFIKNKHKKLYFDNYEKLYFAYVREREQNTKQPILKKIKNKMSNFFK